MTASVIPLTALSEAQRTQALELFAIIRPALEEGVSQAQIARTHQIAPSTVQLWIKRYREKGLSGLANSPSFGSLDSSSSQQASGTDSN